MDKQQTKQILISIFIGACVAFLQTFFTGLVEFMQTYAESIISGIATSVAYLVQKIRPQG